MFARYSMKVYNPVRASTAWEAYDFYVLIVGYKIDNNQPQFNLRGVNII